MIWLLLENLIELVYLLEYVLLSHLVSIRVCFNFTFWEFGWMPCSSNEPIIEFWRSPLPKFIRLLFYYLMICRTYMSVFHCVLLSFCHLCVNAKRFEYRSESSSIGIFFFILLYLLNAFKNRINTWNLC